MCVVPSKSKQERRARRYRDGRKILCGGTFHVRDILPSLEAFIISP